MYISFVEGEPNQSGFKSASTGDRTFFYYHSFDSLKQQLSTNKFTLLKMFTVDFKRNETEFETHRIIIARKNEKA